MYCKKCGKKITDDSVFCNGCGTKVVTQQVSEENSAERADIGSGKWTIIIVISSLIFIFAVIMVLTANGSCEKENVLRFEKISGKEEYRVVGVEEMNNEKLVIPSEHEGLPVTEIGEQAFVSSKFVDVHIPDTITKIGMGAFQDCRELKTIRLSQNLEVIPARMTSNTQIQNFTIPESVKIIEARAFCTMPIQEIVIPDSVEYIGYEAFYSCWKLESVVIGYNIQEIQPEAFRYCSALRSVKFKNPDNIRLFGVTFAEGSLDDPEHIAKYFLNEQYSMRHWYSKDHPGYGDG